MDSRRTFQRSLLAVGFAFIAFFSAEYLLEWLRLGRPGLDAVSWAGANNAKLVDILSPMARAYNNVLAMLLATIGLAIPLTANMHTPKLIDMFLRDRTNQVMLGLFAFGAGHVLWVDYVIGPKFAPMWAFRLAVVGAVLGWAALIPYFFYVVRFLDPSNILARLKAQIERVVEDAAAGRREPDAAQDAVHERLYQVGTLILKALDRADRSVALEGIWAFKRLLDHYGRHKARMPAAWFKIDRKDFVGLSGEALELLNEERTWFEQKALTQLFFCYQSALSKASDVISSVSDATRVIASQDAARNDERALALAVRFFNNYLREAIKKKDVHAIYDLFYQYRVLGRDACDRPALLRQIAHYFRVYAAAAAAAGLDFVPQLCAFDLGSLTRSAFEAHSPAAPDLLGEVCALKHVSPSGAPLPLVVKAKVKLGAFLVEAGLAAEAARLRDDLAGLPADALAAVEHDLVTLAERAFWEVTDRQVNLEWVPPERRPHVTTFVAQVRAAAVPGTPVLLNKGV